MADVHDKHTRSRNMSAIKNKNTKPELWLRKQLHARGFRYRINDKKLPGKPDIVLPKYHAVIFVHGCFWHQHPGCRRATRPASNKEYWGAKLAGNVARDKSSQQALLERGWRVHVVWECETKDVGRLTDQLVAFLGPAGRR